jgi:hypothetical protein
VSTLTLPFLAVELRHQPLPHASSSEAVEVPVHRAPAPKVLRKHTPLAARLGHVHDAVDDPAQIARRSAAQARSALGRRQQGVDPFPLIVRQVCRIRRRRAHVSPFY